jgi:sialic acid synthase
MTSLNGARPRRSIKLGPVVVDDDSPCFVVAEIGQNHQGDLRLAKTAVAAAKDSGADAVKFQKRDPDLSAYTTEFLDRPYDSPHSFGRTYREHRSCLELDRADYVELRAYAENLGLVFLATPFDRPSADLLADIGVPAFKIASGDITNVPLLRHVSAFGRPMIVSTGGASVSDIDRAHEIATSAGAPLAFLQCTAAYPPDIADLNIGVVSSLRERYPDVVVGLSDHSRELTPALLAFALGARIVEKHFTLNRRLPGSDHAISAEPPDLRALTSELRLARLALGDNAKRPLAAERSHLLKTAKKLVAARDLPAHHLVAEADIAVKCPGDGLRPHEEHLVVGHVTTRPIRREEAFTLDALTPAAEPAAKIKEGRPA